MILARQGFVLLYAKGGKTSCFEWERESERVTLSVGAGDDALSLLHLYFLSLGRSRVGAFFSAP